MRSIRLHALVPTEDAALVFKTITDFAGYPAAAEDVRSVTVHPRHGEEQLSDWVVNFRRGVMHWTELDRVRTDDLAVDFAQTEGDFSDFRGSWRLSPVAAGCEVTLKVTYDFGIESLAGLMDPLAERVIKRAVCLVLAGVVGTVDVLGGGEALTDLWDLPPETGIHVRTPN